MKSDWQKLLIDKESLELYTIVGFLAYIDGEWRWDKTGYANEILIDTSLADNRNFERRSYVVMLREEQKKLHSLLD